MVQLALGLQALALGALTNLLVQAVDIDLHTAHIDRQQTQEA
jgi:hypothetical protein